MNDNTITDPRLQIGANRAPLITVEELAAQHPSLIAAVEEYERLAAKFPKILEDDDDLDRANALVGLGTDAADGIEAARVIVKRPYLDANEVVQSFFKGLETRVRTALKVPAASGGAYMQRKEDKAQAKRDEEARVAREKAEAERKAAEDARRIADAAAAAAAKADAERKAEADRVAAAAAEEARRRESTAVSAQHGAAVAAMAKPVHTVTRTMAGTSSLKHNYVHTIEDIGLLQASIKMLLPYFTVKEYGKAIEAYIKADQHLENGRLKDPEGKGGIPGVEIKDDKQPLYRR